MKRNVILSVLLLVATVVSARDYYNHSIGIMAGSTYGVSYKGYVFPVEGLALLGDMYVNLYSTTGGMVDRYKGDRADMHFDVKNSDVMTFQVNPNIVYQHKIKSWNFGAISWYAGGGLSMGLLKQLNRTQLRMKQNGKPLGDWYSSVLDINLDKDAVFGKFGLNAVGGAELYFTRVPLVLDLDFRPGYCVAWRGFKYGAESGTMNVNFFDWAIAASLRYRF